MKIALIAPPLPLPPVSWGPVEAVVHDLGEALVRRGHEVLLFASARSRTSARLLPYAGSDPDPEWPVPVREQIFESAGRYAVSRAESEEVDVIHDHIYTSVGATKIPTLHTVHGFPAAELVGHLAAICGANEHRLCAISQRQKALLLEQDDRLPFSGVVHHGLNFSDVRVQQHKQDFFLFLGRASPEKGADTAISVAMAAGVKLVLALRARLPAERKFLETKLKPLAEKSMGQVTILDEARTNEKFELLGKARGLLFTSRWEEPFGLVIIEAMACGTPVFAFRRGAAPELIVDGVTGFLAADEVQMAALLAHSKQIDPMRCRAHVDENFSVETMVEHYEQSYRRLI
jgi:glycosyltransferase involved in cell wall biosynthesis